MPLLLRKVDRDTGRGKTVNDPDSDVVTLTTRIEIDAPVAKVWSILTDFAAYPLWNPFLTQVEGKLRRRAPIQLTLSAGERPPLVVSATLVALRPQRHLAWAGEVVAPGLFLGEHHIHVEAGPGGTTLLAQEDHYRGVFAPTFSEELIGPAKAGWHAMNLAAKARAET